MAKKYSLRSRRPAGRVSFPLVDEWTSLELSATCFPTYFCQHWYLPVSEVRRQRRHVLPEVISLVISMTSWWFRSGLQVREILCEYEHLRSSLKGSGYLMACKCCAYCFGLQRLSADRERFLWMMFKDTLSVNGNESFYSWLFLKMDITCTLLTSGTYDFFLVYENLLGFFLYYYSGLQSFLFTYKDLTPGRVLSIQLHTRMHAHSCTHTQLSK